MSRVQQNVKLDSEFKIQKREMQEKQTWKLYSLQKHEKMTLK